MIVFFLLFFGREVQASGSKPNEALVLYLDDQGYQNEC